jgi:hypothetical protein
MDNFELMNHEELEVLIRANNNVIGVFTWHVHTVVAATFAGVPLIGAPGIVSTMRLESETDPVADSDAMPGFAVHTIEESNLRTVFHYLSPSAL